MGFYIPGKTVEYKRFYSVWDKARLSLELAESKLRTLHSQLKLQDKEELTLKRLKAEGGDKVLSSVMDPDPDLIRIQSGQ